MSSNDRPEVEEILTHRAKGNSAVSPLNEPAVESQEPGGTESATWFADWAVWAAAGALTLTTVVLRVPRAWWPIAPLAYATVFWALATSPRTTKGRLALVAVVLSGGFAGFLSIVTAGLIGWLRDPCEGWGCDALVITGYIYFAAGVVLVGLSVAQLFKPQGLPTSKRVAAWYVALASICIAAVQAAWIFRMLG